jgi:hypothetical protein
MISGFIIVKDVLKPGYPFVEAIASALPICDEFLILDGYSTDGTYEVVQRISELNPKVKIFRHKWPTEKRLSILGEVTNWIRAKCSGDYIFSVQANEVVHETSAPFIKAIPQMCAGTETFSLPFVHFMRDYRFAQEFRLRFSKNLPSIVASPDAWTLGISRKFVRSETLKNLAHPRRLLRYLSRGMQWTYANTCQNPPYPLTRGVYLPIPIFRYWALFPQNFVDKCLKHKEMFSMTDFAKTADSLQNHMGDLDFWKTAAQMHDDNPYAFKYIGEFSNTSIKDHPKIMQGLLSDQNAKVYYVREELFELIPKL